ncbi:hypothetical protein [Streptomyces sp. KLOTTS4A1]
MESCQFGLDGSDDAKALRAQALVTEALRARMGVRRRRRRSAARR